VSQQDFASFGEKYPLANSLEEQRAAHVLELLDLQGYRRMRQVQLLRCPGKGQMACGDREDLELAYRGISHRLAFIKQTSQYV